MPDDAAVIATVALRGQKRLFETLRRILEEWWAERRFPPIEFRDGLTGRRAAVAGGPEVWEIVAAARDYGDDLDGLREHFGWLGREALDAALEYYARFPERINLLIEENERPARYVAERPG